MLDMKIRGEEVIRLAEAGERVGLSPSTLRNQIKKGVLPGILEGKTYFVRVKDLNKYVSTNKGKPGASSPRHPRTGNRTPRKTPPPATGGTTDEQG